MTTTKRVVERAEARAQNGEALDDRDVVPTRERDVPVHALDQFEVARIGVFGRKLARPFDALFVMIDQPGDALAEIGSLVPVRHEHALAAERIDAAQLVRPVFARRPISLGG